MVTAGLLHIVNGGGGPAKRKGSRFPSEGYAAYQIQETLSMVDPIKPEPGIVQHVNTKKYISLK